MAKTSFHRDLLSIPLFKIAVGMQGFFPPAFAGGLLSADIASVADFTQAPLEASQWRSSWDHLVKIHY